MTGDYAEQHYGCPFDSIGCRRCIWGRRGGVCDLLAILKARAEEGSEDE